jgi:hypothetical protein
MPIASLDLIMFRILRVDVLASIFGYFDSQNMECRSTYRAGFAREITLDLMNLRTVRFTVAILVGLACGPSSLQSASLSEPTIGWGSLAFIFVGSLRDAD